ncbi:cupin domain-containing protein [bacterium]|nr:MAG: cupin domain-containing protein [bacterium]
MTTKTAPSEVVRIGKVECLFLAEGGEGTSRTAFELTVGSSAAVPEAHFHNDVDELVYGLEGALTYTLDGVPHVLASGDSLIVPRGHVHAFKNDAQAPARALIVLTPGDIGAEFFREVGSIVNAGGKPDLAKIRETMLRYGLTPA